MILLYSASAASCASLPPRCEYTTDPLKCELQRPSSQCSISFLSVNARGVAGARYHETRPFLLNKFIKRQSSFWPHSPRASVLLYKTLDTIDCIDPTPCHSFTSDYKSELLLCLMSQAGQWHSFVIKSTLMSHRKFCVHTSVGFTSHSLGKTNH